MTLRNRFEALQEEENEEEVDWIQWWAEGKEGNTSGTEEIVVDSSAAESLCSWDWPFEFPIKEVAWSQKTNFLNASGGWMEHNGETKVCCEFAGFSTPVNMKFQVSDARNPLASVARITEDGSIVQIGPQEWYNCISIHPERSGEGNDEEEGSEVRVGRELRQEVVHYQRAGSRAKTSTTSEDSAAGREQKGRKRV